jgi:membrane protein DedA with SNARE-associated domain
METLGLPLPAFPFFVLAGCLIVQDSLSWPQTLAAADSLWFWLGRRLGRRVLNLLCKLSLNPDACVGRSEKLFRNRSAAAILTAKLVPGLNTLVPALAGILGMKFWRYGILDAAGSLIWAGAGLGLGLVFGTEVLNHLASVQHTLVLLLAAMFGLYVLFRIGYRHYLVKGYPVPRIEADELRRKLASGDAVVLVDLRNESVYSDSREVLPGARRIPPAAFEAQVGSLPRGQEIVFYCT